jgi:hypothetical protein
MQDNVKIRVFPLNNLTLIHKTIIIRNYFKNNLLKTEKFLKKSVLYNVTQISACPVIWL